MATNKIDILRAICFTKEDMKDIKNLGDNIKDIDIEFMVEFKKIYEFGVNQLETFINKLDEEGKEIEPEEIEYYVNHLINGPLSGYISELAKDKKYFGLIPDILGIIGNNQKSPQNLSLYPDDGYPTGANNDSFNKSPDFIQSLIMNSTETAENVFRTSLAAFLINDNTLPIIDKKPQTRYDEERTGAWVKKSNGTYMVKDSYYRVKMSSVRSQFFDKVKDAIGEENFRIFEYRKLYSPFSADTNMSISKVYEIEKTFKEGDKEEVLLLDIMGDVFDNREDVILKIENPEKNKEYKLHTIEGQFGI